MGLCTISGGPDNFQGENLRSLTAARSGDGASGIRMIDSVLYIRYATPATHNWSRPLTTAKHGPRVIESSPPVLVIRHFSASVETTLTQETHNVYVYSTDYDSDFHQTLAQ